MAAEAPPPLHQSFRGALDATTDLDDDRLGTTVFPQGFAETAPDALSTHYTSARRRRFLLTTSTAILGISGVEDAFVLFGLKPDDRTSRREQIKMWKHIERAITAEIKRLTGSGRVEAYDQAKQLNANLDNVKRGFAGLQTKEIEHNQAQQRQMFEQAKKV